MANSFNHVFGTEIFPMPIAKISETAAVVPGIDGRKMSKSYENTIPIFAEPDELEAKVLHIKTSSAALGEPLNPEGDTVFTLYSLVSTPEQLNEMRERYRTGDIGYRQAKVELLENLKAYFAPFVEKRRELEKNLDQVEEILRDGAERARREIAETMGVVRDTVGFRRYRRVVTTVA